MEPRMTLLTLGVDDLERALTFYRDGLGFPTHGIVGTEFEHGAVAFFDLANGMRLALWPRRDLAFDTGLAEGPASPTEFSMAYNVNSAAEVDAAMDQAARAGAQIVRPAGGTFWGGYAGYFADPDGHLWEVAWNPAITVPTTSSNDRRIDYIEFRVRDIEETKAFYGSAFGWAFTDYGPSYCEFRDGRLSGGFTTEGEPQPGGPLVVLYGDDLPGLVKAVQNAGGRIAKPIFDFPGGQRFHFIDPNGYELAVWTAVSD